MSFCSGFTSLQGNSRQTDRRMDGLIAPFRSAAPTGRAA